MSQGSCFLTGVRIHIDQGYVLNRRAAHDLLAKIEERAASLRRVIEQLSPLDEVAADALAPAWQQKGAARRKHRLVCKAVADAIAPGFPEIRLFLQWAEHRASSRLAARRGLQEPAPAERQADRSVEEALQEAENLGRQVLDILDPKHVLTDDVRQAITFGTCVKLRGQAPGAIVERVRVASATGGKFAALGLTAGDVTALRSFFGIAPTVASGDVVAS